MNNWNRKNQSIIHQLFIYFEEAPTYYKTMSTYTIETNHAW